MTDRKAAGLFVQSLRHLQGGALQVAWDGAPWASVDATARNLELQIEPLIDNVGEGRSILHEAHVRLWELRGVPAALARAGWRVTLRDGLQEVLRLGRDTSALTGHMRVSPAGLGKLLRRR
jgi:hypothetical protein